MADVLVIGGGGLLGHRLVEEGRARGLEVQTSDRSAAGPDDLRIDLTDLQGTIRTLRRVRVGTVFLAAAMTDVDGCESDPENAAVVNADAPGEIAKACASSGTRLVHFSTDYVFDGSARVPHTEEMVPKPLNVYGRTKLEGERNVRAALPSALVIRTSANFGWNRRAGKTNAVTWILGRLRRKQEVPLFMDQWVSPSYVVEVAKVAFDLLDRGAEGTFHVASRGCLSRVEIGHAVAEAFGLPERLLKPIRLQDAPLKAPRPHRTCLSTEKAERFLDMRFPTFRESIAHMRDHE